MTANDSKSTPKKAERHPLALLESLLGSAESAAAARLEQMHGHLSVGHRASGYDGTAAQIHAQYAQALAPIVQALRAQAEAEAVEPWRTIPQDIAQMVVATGRAGWAATEAQDAQGHGAAMTNSVQLTAERYGQTEPQPMQLLVIEGTDTVLGYMGTSPNSPVIARAMTGAWNWLHEQSAHALAQAQAGAGEGGEAQ